MKKALKYIGSEPNRTKAAFSLVELLVVLVIVASLIALSIPAINAMQKSFGSTGAEGMIGTALSTARTLAIKNGHYSGVRFQKAYDAKGPLEANQYMIFIVYNSDATNLNDGFIAIDGYKPIKLPENVGIIDMVLGSTNQVVNSDSSINDDWEVADATTFSIIFSPSGKLVIHNVQVRNKNGIPDSLEEINNHSTDKVFNKKDEVDMGTIGMFYQDDYAAQDYRLRYYPQNFGFGKEASRTYFYIFDREKFYKLTDKTQRFKYLDSLKAMYINSYTGEIIK